MNFIYLKNNLDLSKYCRINRFALMAVMLCLVLWGHTGCNSGSQTTASRAVGVGLNVQEIIDNRGGTIVANVCTLVSMDELAEILELEPNQIDITDSTPDGVNPPNSSCFFKWEDFDMANTGILLQCLRNPLEDEFPDYIIKFIESKKTSGEQGMDANPIVFEDFAGIGDDGAYSDAGAKCFWRLGDQVVFSIVFNTTHSPKERHRIARELATRMTEAYIAGKG